MSEVRDTRTRWQKFTDQTAMGHYYTVSLDPGDATEVLNYLTASTRRDWRVRGLIDRLKYSLQNPHRTRKGEFVVLHHQDASNVLLLKQAIDLPSEALLEE